MKRILFVFAFLFALVATPTGMALASTTPSTTPTASHMTIQPNLYPDDPGTGP